ncbi:hypothetical protein GcM1_197031, partial [Golovinomyces cichoracearum]
MPTQEQLVEQLILLQRQLNQHSEQMQEQSKTIRLLQKQNANLSAAKSEPSNEKLPPLE